MKEIALPVTLDNYPQSDGIKYYKFEILYLSILIKNDRLITITGKLLLLFS